MPLFDKISTLLRQSGQYDARSMSTKIFISGLPYKTEDEALVKLFGSLQGFVEAKVIRNGKMLTRFGLVTFATEDDANNAVSAMEGKKLEEKVINVFKKP